MRWTDGAVLFVVFFLASPFVAEKAGRPLDAAGLRLRDDIYAVGNSRDVNISIEKFLGRPRSIEPFLKKIGVE